jgi:hypothetical protein
LVEIAEERNKDASPDKRNNERETKMKEKTSSP